MKIQIQVESNGNVASATITTGYRDPVKEGSKALLRLVRLLQQQEGSSPRFYDVFLRGNQNKVKTIKVIRELTGADLKTAKEMVDHGGRIARELTKEKVDLWSQGLRDVGASFEVIESHRSNDSD